MAKRRDGAREEVEAAQAVYSRAVEDLQRQELAADLRRHEGLQYASLDGGRNGPHLVVFDGKVIGETHTTSPGVFNDWYAEPIGEGLPVGPFPTARAAAAGLLRDAVTARRHDCHQSLKH